MKPDKHKKEKNALYKKKHGIPDGSKNDKTPERDRKGFTAGQIQNDKSELRRKEINLGEKNAIRNDEEEKSEIAETRSFLRRKIVSNWKRYEVQENETQTLRGSDFATVLKFSGNVQSHFQYRVDLGPTEGKGNPTTYTKFLNLDCDDLAMSLMSIPLHERLSIETSVFEPSLLQRCVEISKENLSRCSGAEDQLSPETFSSSPSKHHKKESVEIQHGIEMNTKAEMEEKLEETPPVIAERRSMDSEQRQIPDDGFAPKQDNDTLLQVKQQSILPEEPMASKPMLNLVCAKGNAEDDETLNIPHLTEQPVTLESTTAIISKDTVEIKHEEAGNTKTKQTLEELENELDLLLAL